MLGLLLIYFIGKRFHDLADDYDKSKWGFAIIGIVTYYAVSILLGVVLVVLEVDFIERMNDMVLGLLLAPFGILGCVLLHYFLDNKWSNEKPKTDKMIDDIGNE